MCLNQRVAFMAWPHRTSTGALGSSRRAGPLPTWVGSSDCSCAQDPAAGSGIVYEARERGPPFSVVP